jgi:NADH-quinone oxidoreductase subunit M
MQLMEQLPLADRADARPAGRGSGRSAAVGAGRPRQALALGLLAGHAGLAVGAALQFDASSLEQVPARPRCTRGSRSSGSYALGVDGIALSLILMSAILVPVCILAAWHDVPEGGTGRRTTSR